MRRYETIVIVDPDISDEKREALFKRLKELFPQQGGILVEFDEWGTQKLAYEIKKKTRGLYIRLDYCGDGALVNEMERSMKIDDRVLKFMTIMLEKNADVENIKSEMAEAEAKDEPPAPDEDSADDKQDTAADEQEVVEDKAEPGPETEAEAEAEAEGESETEAEPETKPEAEPEPEPETESKAEPETETEAEPETETETEAKPETETEDKAEAETEPEVKDEPETEAEENKSNDEEVDNNEK